jgi:hypothetical protein
MSILRARPRIIGWVQESVIVLIGALDHNIKEAIKLARLNNNFVRP